ncbi:MAG TPA: hypothetical protein DD670_10265 [Planctomycetaceae bacterium]|nr:hypothetical protein [Planctomycetaceae bacterium]
MKLTHFTALACMSLLLCSCGPRDEGGSRELGQKQGSCCGGSGSHETAIDAPTPTTGSSDAALSASHEVAAAWAEETLAGLSLKQKIGQMICVQMQGDVAEDSPEFEKLLDLVRNSEIGAMVVYGGSPVETATVLNRFQKESKIPLLMTIDFEGGPGQQLAGATEFPGNMALAAVGTEELT